MSLDRRQFVCWTAAGALMVGLRAGAQVQAAPLSPWIRIAPDGKVTLYSTVSEMGQGARTGQAQVLADELDAPWEAITVELAPMTPGPPFNQLVTGGSSSISRHWSQLRAAAAAARAQLTAAAAKRWACDTADCVAELGVIRHAKTGAQLSYGELAAEAAHAPAPPTPPLKPATARRYIGKPTPTLENVAKSTGQAQFGLDMRPPSLLRAAIRQAPVYGAQLHSVDERPALALPGVKKVVKLDNAVAVVAADTWTAFKGVRALDPKWAPADEASSSADIETRLAALMKTLDRPLGEKSARKDRAELAALRADYRKAARKVEATYETAYLAHATLEPMNTIVQVRADAVEVWSPTQVPTATRKLVADTLKRPVSEVVLHTTLIGGGYGRRLVPDFAQQAALIAKACAGAPVQLVWSREEDTGHDYYRRPVVSRFRAGLGANGLIDGFEMIAAGADDTLRGDGPGPAPYPLKRYAATQGSFDTSIPQGPWRSVNPGLVAFGREGFIDECAIAAGADPLDYRRRLLGDNGRARRVLDAAAEAIGWGQAKPPGTGRGLALVQCFGSLVATALEAQVAGEALKVTRMAVAADLGTVVNPQQAAAQLEGGATMGLSAALGEAMTFSAGKANETNFNTYKLLRLRQAPKIEVRLLETPDAPLGGVGEVGVPGVAPALANAVFDATGKRVRRLPFSRAGFIV